MYQVRFKNGHSTVTLLNSIVPVKATSHDKTFNARSRI